MKLRLLMIAASAVLLLVPATVDATQSVDQPAADESGHVRMQRNANESAQATTDVPLGPTGSQGIENTSYGGVTAGQAEAGGRREKTCGSGPRCNIYFGQ